MPTITATAADASANSYVTVAEADAYLDARLNVSAYTGAATDDKERALIMATRRVDLERFEGEKSTDGQALKWPRLWATDDDGNEFSSGVIPQIVKDATCELALRFLNDGTTDLLADTGLEQYERVKVGQLEVETRNGFRPGQLPEVVRNILRPVLIGRRLTARRFRS